MIAFDILEYECPEGWTKLVNDLCAELSLKLEELGLLNDYIVVQAKEKFGELRWYDSGGTDETDEIIRKYAEFSMLTCCECGEPAEYITTGYISPYCEKCIDNIDDTATSIDEYYKFWEE